MPSHCLCALRPAVSARAGVCLIMADIKPLKPSSTGWLIANVVADIVAFGWARTEVDPALLALEKRVKYAGWESGGQKASKDGMHSTKLDY